MCNKLFLSHSSEDLRIVTAFVNFMRFGSRTRARAVTTRSWR